jgi:glycosyltransferase involved in cell wall biosynthesis
MPPLKFWERQNASFKNSLLFLTSERLGLYLAYFFADRLLCVSESTKRQLIDAGLRSNKIFVVECGVDFKKVRKIVTGVRDKKYEAIFMKRIQAVKGAFDLPVIWKEVVKKIPQAKLAVVGSNLEGVDGLKTIQLSKEFGLDKNIDFLGVIYDDKTKFTILAQSSLFILPTYEENWAIVIGEALAAGIPVVTYDLKELRQVWRGAVTYIPTGDKNGMAKKILELLNDSRELRRLSTGGIEFMKHYDWQEIAKRELKILTRRIK